MIVSTALSVPGARVLIVGTGRHQPRAASAAVRESFPVPDVPAVTTTVEDLRLAFIDKCGVDEGRIRTSVDPHDPRAFGDLLTDAATQADDLLLFYYVGHGLLNDHGELYLATASTDDAIAGLGHKALSYSYVRDTLRRCRARSIVVVLDCCFAGRAGGPLGTAVADAFGSTFVRGSYLLASAAPEEEALAKPGEKYTAFSGKLLRLLYEGEETGPPRLDIGYVYDYLCRALPENGFPMPYRQAEGQADRLVLAPNPAYPSYSVPPASSSDGPLDDSVCPYRGLERFEVTDTDYFFGRQQSSDKLLTALAARLSDAGLLAVLGPSGSGKSSLLRAGLLPALRNGKLAVAGSHSWPALILTPGEHPLLALASAVSAVAHRPRNEIHSSLTVDPTSMVPILHQALQQHLGRAAAGGARVVLVVDQFEELFTACRDEAERKAFIHALRVAGNPTKLGTVAPALVVFGVRTDFYEQCSKHQDLIPALERPMVLRAMTDAELREAIENPAAVAGLALQPGLVDLLLHDLRTGDATDSGSGGGLPLLSYALRATWQRRQARLLTMAGYQATGGIWGVVAQRANRIYEELGVQLGPAGQQAARQLLLSLVRVGDGATDTRRRVNLTDLTRDRPADEAAAITAARDAFAHPRARLIKLDGDSAEITHEALVRAWPMLHQWIDQDRGRLLIHQRLTEATEIWARADRKRKQDALYRGSLLADARVATDDPVRPLNPRERAFIDASRRAQQRRTRRLQLLVAVMAILLVAAATGFVAAVSNAQLATERKQEARSQQLAAQAQQFAEVNPEASIQLALAAWHTAHTPAARGAVLSAQRRPYVHTISAAKDSNGSPVFASTVATNRNGSLVARADQDGVVRVFFNRAKPTKLAAELRGEIGPIQAVAFSPQNNALAAGGDDGRIHVWPDPLNQSATRKVLGGHGRGHKGRVWTVAFNRDGSILASGGADGTVRRWSVSTGQEIGPPLRARQGAVFSVAFQNCSDSRICTRLASAGDDGTVYLWNQVTGARMGTLAEKGDRRDPVYSVAFSPDGSTLAAGGYDQTVRMWDPSTGVRLGIIDDHNLFITQVAFANDGQGCAPKDDTRGRSEGECVLATINQESVRVWTIKRQATAVTVTPRARLESQKYFPLGASFRDNSNHLAILNGDGSIGMWNLRRPAISMVGAVNSVAFAPDGEARMSVDGRGSIQQHSDGFDATLNGGVRNYVNVVYSPTGDRYAIAGDSKLVQVSETGTLGGNSNFPASDTVVNAIAFGADDESIFTGDINGVITQWDDQFPNDGIKPESVRQFTTHDKSPIHAMALSNDRRMLATGSENGIVQLWNTKTGQQIGKLLTGHRGAVYAVAFNCNNTILATGGHDNTVRLWDTKTGQQIGEPLTGHTGRVSSVAFNAEGTLASGSHDRTARLWKATDPKNPRTYTAWATLTGHSDKVNVVAFRPGTNELYTGSDDRTAQAWDLDFHNVEKDLCEAWSSDVNDRQTLSQLVPEETLHDLPKLCQ